MAGRPTGASALFSARSIAIVGDSPRSERGEIVRDHLSRLGFAGSVYAINPKYDRIGDVSVHPSLSALPERVDLVMYLVQAAAAVELLPESVEHGARAAVVVASGFTETGQQGAQLQEKLRRIAGEGDLRLCGPNCYGVLNLHSGLAAYSGTLPTDLQPGRVAFFSQSGALTHALLNPAARRGIGFSLIASSGNEAVTTMAEYVRAGIADDQTEVIALFVEGIRDLPAFVDALTEARDAQKPVVICKVGRSEKAQQVASAHSGAVTGDDKAFTALCEATGAIRVDSLDALLETITLLAHHTVVRSPVAFVSISGGGNGLLADAATDLDLDLATFTPETVQALATTLPDFATPSNPLDLTGAVGADPHITTRAVEILRSAAEVGTVAFAINTGTSDTSAEVEFYRSLMTQAMAGTSTGADLVFFTMTAGPLDRSFREVPERNGIPILSGMNAALGAVAAVSKRSPRRDWYRECGDRLLDGVRHHMDESTAKTTFAAAGITVPREVVVKSVDEAVAAADALGGTVVIKSNSASIPHKSDVGAVITGLRTEIEIRDAAQRVQEISLALTDGRDGELLLAEEIPPGLDLLVGVVGVPGMGHLVVVGPGGVDTEILSGHRAMLGPLSHDQAVAMVNGSAMARQLRGHRGKGPYDIDAIASVLTTLSRVFEQDRSIVEMEINPLRVFEAGCCALDALIVQSHDDRADVTPAG